ncbi:MAG: IS4 family transposase [bacterium]|nr:IS4 family transposase [bacterium]
MEEGNTLNIIRQCYSKILPIKDLRTKVLPLAFIVTLVFCFLGDTKTTSLEAKRRWMISQLNQTLSKSSFWERLSRNRLKKLLQSLLAELMTKMTNSIIFGKDILSGLGVSKILLLDSSSISLWNGASKIFPGTRTTAGIKWHCCFDILSGAMCWFEMTPTATHDRKCFPPMKLLKGALIIFDLGYWDYGLLLAIEEVKGFFLSRIKNNSTIKIFKVISGISKKHSGKKLSSLNFKKRNGLIVELVGKILINKMDHHYRAIGFWNPNDKSYHWYITNLKVTAIVVYPLYRVRWAIELIFKSCKQSLNANEIPSTCKNIIESLLLASLVAQLTSYSILSISAKHIEEEKMLAMSFQRAAKITVALASDFIKFLIKKNAKNFNYLLKRIEMFANEIFDPNFRHRPTSLQNLEKILNQNRMTKKQSKILKFKQPSKAVANYETRKSA